MSGKTLSRIVVALIGMTPLAFQSSSMLGQSVDISQFGHTSWITQDGSLPEGVGSIAQTTDGYLWLATSSHLFRFDGVRFVEWKPPQDDSTGATIILGTRDGSLWIGSYEGGLLQLKDGKVFRHSELDKVLVTALVEDSSGTVWAGGIGKSSVKRGPPIKNLCRMELDKTECYKSDTFPGLYVNALFEDHEGRLWAGAANSLWKIQPGAPQRFADTSANGARTIAEDASGNLVLGESNELQTLGTDGKLHSYPLDPKLHPVAALRKDRDGALWIGTRGLGLGHLHDGRQDTFTKRDGLSSDDVRSVFEDREGNVWVGTVAGLDRFRRLPVTVVSPRQGLASEAIDSVLPDAQGVWVGTTQGLNLIKADAISTLTSKQGLPSDVVTTLFRNSNGRLLVATNDAKGMVWLDNGWPNRIPVVGGENVQSITEDVHGDLWIMNRESGLMHLQGDGRLVEIFPWKEVRVHATSLTYDRGRDAIWITGAQGDMGLFKDGKVIQRFGKADGLGSGAIRDAHVELDGSIWFSTSVGLARFKDGKFSFLSRRNGLPCDAIHWMARDDVGNVWLYSECGLIRMSQPDLSAWAKDSTRTVSVLNLFDNADGIELLKDNGWYTPQVGRSNDGQIVFAMQSGLGVVDPKHLVQNTIPPPVHIEDIVADGKELPSSGELIAPKRVHNLHIDFTALSLVMPTKVRLRYQLEGFDREWSPLTSAREATYTNLPPGNYRFRVIACNNDGVWNMDGASANFRVPPAFTQTLWFPLLLIVLACACVLLLFVWRLNRVTALARDRFAVRIAERERIAQDLHDTLLQGFQGLILRMGAATRRFPDTEPGRKNMDEALDLARRVMEEGRDRVKNLRESYSPPSELLQQLRDFCGTLEHGAVKATVSVEGISRPIRDGATEDLFQISKECLVNAYLHSKATEISCIAIFDERFFTIVCRDNGCGIEQEVLSNGADGHFGLVGMRERADRLRGRLAIESQTGEGTTVTVRVPGSVAYFPLGWRSRLKARIISIWRAEPEHDRRVGTAKSNISPNSQ